MPLNCAFEIVRTATSLEEIPGGKAHAGYTPGMPTLVTARVGASPIFSRCVRGLR